MFLCFFFKQETAYDLRISDWSSDVCSSDLAGRHEAPLAAIGEIADRLRLAGARRIPGGTNALALDRAEPDPERARSGERRVGNECVSTCRSRGEPYH